MPAPHKRRDTAAIMRAVKRARPREFDAVRLTYAGTGFYAHVMPTGDKAREVVLAKLGDMKVSSLPVDEFAAMVDRATEVPIPGIYGHGGTPDAALLALLAKVEG